jgi:hypothetical protein
MLFEEEERHLKLSIGVYISKIFIWDVSKVALQQDPDLLCGPMYPQVSVATTRPCNVEDVKAMLFEGALVSASSFGLASFLRLVHSPLS